MTFINSLFTFRFTYYVHLFRSLLFIACQTFHLRFFFFVPEVHLLEFAFRMKAASLLAQIIKHLPAVPSACNAGHLGFIPGLGRYPGEGNGTPLQYSCLQNSMDVGAWSATVHGVAKSRTRLNDFTFTLECTFVLVHRIQGWQLFPLRTFKDILLSSGLHFSY